MTEAYAVAAEAVKRNPERHGVTVLVHRLSWLMERGEIEDGLQRRAA